MERLVMTVDIDTEPDGSFSAKVPEYGLVDYGPTPRSAIRSVVSKALFARFVKYADGKYIERKHL